MLRNQRPEISRSGKSRHRTRSVMPEGMNLVLYCESKDSFVSARVATALRKKGVRKSGCWSAG
jgi:hypothetical protein